MAAGRLQAASSFCAFSILGLLAVCVHHDVEASVVHKKVGETVEFHSNAPAQGVTFAHWKHGGVYVEKNQQFTGRIRHDGQNYSLIVRELTLQDSGEYIFVSQVNNEQRPTITIELHVHEPITDEPLVSITSFTHEALNQSCTVSLKCSSSVRGVSYKWTVGGRTQAGPQLRHVIRLQDGEIEFSCTISNYFEEKSKSVIQRCSNGTFTNGPDSLLNEDQKVAGVALGSRQLVLPVAAGISSVILLISVAVVAAYCFKKKQAGISGDQTVYAYVSDVKQEDPCSVYETVQLDRPVTPAVNTVYDKVQLHRLGPDTMSHYQDIS